MINPEVNGSDLDTRTHEQRTVSCCIAALRQLRQIRQLVPPVRQRRAGRLACLSCTSTPVRIEHTSARLIIYVAPTTSLTRSSAYTGCVFRSTFQYKIAILTYKVLQGTAPRYLGPLVNVSDLPDQSALRSASTSRLVVPPFKLSTIGSRTFKVAAARTWEDLPEDVSSSPTLPIFRNRLKTHLFR